MAYIFTLVRRDRTDAPPWHLSLPVWGVRCVLLLVVALPFIAFFLGISVLAPVYMTQERANLKTEITRLEEYIHKFDNGFDDMEKENARLKEELRDERELRAAAEAKIAINEGARTEVQERLQELEEKNSELAKGMEFYEAFIRPATDRDELQCYNITAKYSRGKLAYGVNFLRTDRKAKTALETRVKFRVLAGGEVLNMSEGGEAQANHTRPLKIKDAHRLNGSIAVKVPDQTLRVLDIKAYDAKDEILAHCWKAF